MRQREHAIETLLAFIEVLPHPKVLPMSEWEYLTIDLNDLPPGTAVIDALNRAGKEGWELVAITLNHIAYLRRQIAKPATRSRRSAPTAR
jgi:hypothetical protein